MRVFLQPSTRAPHEGLLGGRYEILEQIGAGGFATVYRVRDTLKGDIVALKMVHRDVASDVDAVARFRREILVASRLYHRNIVSVLDYGGEDGIPYMVMEYLPSSLAQILRERGSLAAEEAVSIASQICQALDVAHQRDVVHRDLKPQNVMVASDGTMKVVDFGLAKAFDVSPGVTSRVMGTPHYISPEQAKGQAVDQRTDVYAMGVILYQMLTGSVPFEADTPYGVIRKHIEEPPEMPLRVKVPNWLRRVVLKALAKKPEDRYQNARQMLDDLERAD